MKELAPEEASIARYSDFESDHFVVRRLRRRASGGNFPFSDPFSTIFIFYHFHSENENESENENDEIDSRQDARSNMGKLYRRKTKHALWYRRTTSSHTGFHSSESSSVTVVGGEVHQQQQHHEPHDVVLEVIMRIADQGIEEYNMQTMLLNTFQ